MGFGRREQILAIVIVPALLALVLLALFLRNSLHEWAIRNWTNDQTAFVQIMADRIDADLNKAEALIRFAARTPEFSSLPELARIDRQLNGLPEHLDAGKRKLLETLRREGGFSVLFVLTPDGDHYISHPFAMQRSLKRYNLADRGYFKEAQRRKTLVVSDSFVGADGVPAVAIDMPVLDAQGEIVLHLGGVLHLDRLSSHLIGSRIAPFDRAQIFDRLGRQIADSAPAGATENGDRQLAEAIFSERAERTNVGSETRPIWVTRNKDEAGTEWIGFQATLDNDWRLFLFRSTAGTQAEITPQVTQATLLAAAILLAQAALGLFMALRLDRRIRRADEALQTANATLSERVAERTAELRRLEMRHRTLFEASADAVLLLDGDRIVDCNPAALKIFGARVREQIVGQQPSALSPKHQPQAATDSDVLERRLIEQATTEGSVAFEWVHRRLDSGRDFFAEVILSRIDIDGGMLMQATLRDVTERHQTEMELRKLSLAVEQSPHSIVITDTDGRIEYVNDAFVRISGYAQRELIGENPKLLQSGQTPQATYQSLWAALTAGECWQGEFINRRKNGEIYVEFGIFAPIRQPDGSISHYLAIKEDITEKKHTAEELDRHRSHLEELVAQRTAELAQAKAAAEAATLAKSVFLANMSHEIRTPLNAITGLAYLMKRDGVSGRQAERLEKIGNAGNLLLGIINDILDLSKIEAGKIVLEEVPLSLNAIAGNVVSMLQDRAQAKGLVLRLETEAMPHPVLGDPTRISQALLNYASNAVKFTESGHVTLRIHPLAEDSTSVLVRFEVEDTGPGIDDETQARLFAAFEQADSSTTRKHGGTGLGLAITRHLARLMQGDSGVTSTLHRGSTFWFTARLTKGKATMPAEHSGQPDTVISDEAKIAGAHAGRHILLVEDEPINREVTLELLSHSGLKIAVAEDGEAAVGMAADNDYALILMDMQMPRMDGLEAAREIRRQPRHRETPIIALTANAFAEDKARCLDAGMNDFIGKPIDPDQLFHTLLKWLRR